LMMSVPVMSDGIRSGVNWMRLNFNSSTLASVAMSSVLARPGTPTMRLLPPTNSVSSTCSMTSLWPMIRFCSSAMIALRPPFILSARAISSVDSKVRVSVAGSTCASPLSVSQTVNDVVHAQLVRFVRFVDRLQPGVRPLPVLGDVGVVVDHHHDPLGRVVVLVDGAEDRRRRIVILRHIEGLDFEECV